jgi:hypothetical protein
VPSAESPGTPCPSPTTQGDHVLTALLIVLAVLSAPFITQACASRTRR